MSTVAYVDLHSHVLPTLDDGVQSMDDALQLCRSAASRGTATQFVTPHVGRGYPLDPTRRALIAENLAELQALAPLEIKLGYEVTPSHDHTGTTLAALRMSGTECVLIETPLTQPVEALLANAQAIEAEGLMPLIAHPEQCAALANRFELFEDMAARGWRFVLSARSLLGDSGRIVEAMSWRLVDHGYAIGVASDAHGLRTPPHLDGAHALVRARAGRRADAMFDGTIVNR